MLNSSNVAARPAVRVLAALVVLVVASALVWRRNPPVNGGSLRPDNGTAIGGDWVITEASVDYKGRPYHRRLWKRTPGDTLILYSQWVGNWRYYGPDCVLYEETTRVLAACGDRSPAQLTLYPESARAMRPDGFLESRIMGQRAGSNKVVPEEHFLSIDSIRVLAARRPRWGNPYRSR